MAQAGKLPSTRNLPKTGELAGDTSPPTAKVYEQPVGIQQTQRMSLTKTWMRAIVDGVVARLRPGRHREYNYDAIAKVAESVNVFAVDKQDWYIERVWRECKRRNIKVPREKLSTTLTDICEPIYKLKYTKIAQK
jgi:hypothetical protein